MGFFGFGDDDPDQAAKNKAYLALAQGQSPLAAYAAFKGARGRGDPGGGPGGGGTGGGRGQMPDGGMGGSDAPYQDFRMGGGTQGSGPGFRDFAMPGGQGAQPGGGIGDDQLFSALRGLLGGRGVQGGPAADPMQPPPRMAGGDPAQIRMTELGAPQGGPMPGNTGIVPPPMGGGQSQPFKIGQYQPGSFAAPGTPVPMARPQQMPSSIPGLSPQGMGGSVGGQPRQLFGQAMAPQMPQQPQAPMPSGPMTGSLGGGFATGGGTGGGMGMPAGVGMGGMGPGAPGANEMDYRVPPGQQPPPSFGQSQFLADYLAQRFGLGAPQ